MSKVYSKGLVKVRVKTTVWVSFSSRIRMEVMTRFGVNLELMLRVKAKIGGRI